MVGGQDVSAEQEFDAFVRARQREVLRSAWLLCGSWGEAEDLAQGALTTTWRHWGSLRDREAALGYVRRVMFTDHLRSRRAARTAESPVEVVPEPSSAEHGRPYTQVERRAALTRALAALPPRQRAAVVLRHFCDLSEKDTAEIMGCRVGTVKSHVNAALETLRRSPSIADALYEGAPR